jgi:chromosome segregation ATPase
MNSTTIEEHTEKLKLLEEKVERLEERADNAEKEAESAHDGLNKLHERLLNLELAHNKLKSNYNQTIIIIGNISNGEHNVTRFNKRQTEDRATRSRSC